MMRLPDPRNCAPQLHFACQQRPLSLETIQQLVEQHPLSVEVRGEDGWLPIHRVCRREPSVAVVRCLVKAWPQGVNHWTGDGVKDLGARLAIHLACQHGASLEVVKCLVTVQPETLEVPCLDHSLTPLDYAYKCWDEDHLPQTRAVIEWLESSVPSFQRMPRPSLNAIAGPEGSAAYEPRAPLHVTPRPDGERPVYLKKLPPASRQTSWSTAATASESISSFEATSRSNQSHQRMDSASTMATIPGILPEISDQSSFRSRNQSEPDTSTIRTPNDVPGRRHGQSSSVSIIQRSVSMASTGPDSVISSSEGTFTKSVISSSSHTTASIFLNKLFKPRQKERTDKYLKQLEQALKEQPPSLVLVKLTIEKCKEAVALPVPDDYMGQIPLHLACISGASIHVMQALVGAWLDSLKVANTAGYLPLHLCFTGKIATLDVVQYLISQYPDAVSVPTKQDGMLPLHLACYYGAPTSIIHELVIQYPQGVLDLNHEHKKPLHLAKHPASPHSPVDEEAIKILKKKAKALKTK